MRSRSFRRSVISVLATATMLVGAEANAADCFGTAAWQTVGASALCMTTSREAWDRIAGDEEIVDFARGGGSVPVRAGGADVAGPVEVAWIPEVALDAIGRDDYRGDPGTTPIPEARRLSAGRHTEMFLDVPEIPQGSTWEPARTSLYDPSQGLYVALERGVSFNLDFDETGARPILWSGVLDLVTPGQLGVHVVLGDPDAPAGSEDLAVGVIPRLPVDGAFLGLAAPPGTDLARLQFYLREGPGTAFELLLASTSDAVVPEPSTALLVGLGLLALAGPRSRGRFAAA